MSNGRVVRMPPQPQQQLATPRQQSAPTMWDSSTPTWDCGCDGDVPPFPCPPPGWPPPGCPPWWSGQNSPPWYPGANAGVSFGQSPPANPVRGHFWFDGQTLWMFDAVTWVPVGGSAASGGAGAATGPSPPPNPANGALWWNGNTMFIWDGVAWISATQTKTYTQPTAPPAPNPGDQWWNGTQMYIWDGSVWHTVGPGATVGPVPTTTNVFAITQSTSLAINTSAGNWSTVAFSGAPNVDTESGWNAGTLKYTPTKAGVYAVGIRSLMNTTGTWTGIAVLKNDAGSFASLATDMMVCEQSVNGAFNGWMQGHNFVSMNGTTDYLRMWTYGVGTFGGAGGNPVFAAWLMP